MEDFQHMEKFGHVHRTGVYVFDHCKQCFGPMFGHKAKEAECAKEKYTSDQVLDMEQEIMTNMCFEAGLARIDTRSSAKKCNICNEEFENKLNMINHMKATHGTAHGDKPGKMDDAIAQLANAVEQFVKKSTVNDPKKDFDKKTTQLTKAKLPPISSESHTFRIVALTYEKFKRRAYTLFLMHNHKMVYNYERLPILALVL